ncbi:ceramide-1-phosphate transfer protein-like [Poecilia reticulata]|uniref:Ceramide-1-phosphate transfer protein-like n=1 Tax=Poecilia reticulata TaxID=8081 RepID=A0A3P9PJL8_POERE|nr:PREDICTED: ceramide-1-phosphate transfer protein-like [Poecilia reticulata]
MMVPLRRTLLLRYLLLSTALALLLFLTSFWLPQGEQRGCGSVWQPCLTYHIQTPLAPPIVDERAESDEAPPLVKDCPGQTFQARELLRFLRSSLAEDDEDVLLEPYLLSWDQLLNFMESLGTMVSFFSQKVREKTELIRQLSLKRSSESRSAGSSGLQTPAAFGLKTGAYRSVRSMVEAELQAGTVSFSRRTDSGCRTLLRLHRSLLWLKLMLEGLSEGPDAEGRFKTPGELSRDAYKVALAPHHPWMLRQAAEIVFLALPDREYFLQLVCVQKQEEATPVLRIIIHALSVVHTRTQRLLAKYNMLELP